VALFTITRLITQIEVSEEKTVECAFSLSESTFVMLRLLETLQYRALRRSIIVGRIINVVNHGHGPAFVWQTRNYFCHRYTTIAEIPPSVLCHRGLFVTAETALREGARTSCRYQSAIIAARTRPPI